MEDGISTFVVKNHWGNTSLDHTSPIVNITTQSYTDYQHTDNATSHPNRLGSTYTDWSEVLLSRYIKEMLEQ